MSNDLLQILGYLLPGFVTAWIFHGLTPHPKESQFERIVEALVFTAIIQAIYELLYNIWSGPPTSRVLSDLGVGSIDLQSSLSAETFVRVAIATILGIALAFLSNADWFHSKLRQLKVTRKTGYPSVWYRQFYSYPSYVNLYLSDGRILSGWVDQWPSKQEEGHLALKQVQWLTESEPGALVPTDVPSTDVMLIRSNLVEIVEFLRSVQNEKELDCDEE